LLAAAGAWNVLSSEYASVAAELSAVVASVQAGAWSGPTATAYAAAHAPYLEWLTLASAYGAVAAAQHETVATAYSAAVAAMPTLPELAANHAIHGVLAATNFFGLNTIPIALNEADYVRMWIQAATTMVTYESVAEASTAASSGTPESAAPQIVNSDGQSSSAATENPFEQIHLLSQQLVQRALSRVGFTWDPTNGTLNGIPYGDYTIGQNGYWLTRLFLYEQSADGLQNFIQEFLTNPVQAIQGLQSAGFSPTQAIGSLLAHPVAAAAIATSPLYSMLSAASSAAVVSVVAGIPIPEAAAVPVVAAPALAPVAAVAHTAPVATVPSVSASGAPAAPAAPATTVSTVAGTAPPSVPAAPPAPTFFPYAVAGPPGTGFDPVFRRRAAAGALAKAPASDIAAEAAAAAARRRSRRKRKKQDETLHEYADAFADLAPDHEPDLPPHLLESAAGAGPLGFAGTVAREAQRPAGLATLDGDPFGGGPTAPMMPNTWGPEERHERGA
jgi:PPE-repeat protein